MHEGKWRGELTRHARRPRPQPKVSIVDPTRSAALSFALCALLALPACGKAASTAKGQPPALERTAAAPSAPRPERSGLSAAVVWKAPTEPAAEGKVCSSRIDRLEVSEVRADSDALYVDVAHHAAKSEATHPSAPGRVATILRDGCPVRAPRVSGSIFRDFWQPGTLSIALAELPDGDLDLTFGAFGAVRVVPLHKKGKRIVHLRDRDRKGATIMPAIPAWHVPESLSLPTPNCDEEKP